MCLYCGGQRKDTAVDTRRLLENVLHGEINWRTCQLTLRHYETTDVEFALTPAEKRQVDEITQAAYQELMNYPYDPRGRKTPLGWAKKYEERLDRVIRRARNADLEWQRQGNTRLGSGKPFWD